MKRLKKEKDQCIENNALQVISNNEQLEQGSCLYVLAYEGRFDIRLFDELMHSISVVSTYNKPIGVQLLYQLYIIQRISIVLKASHFDPEDLYCIESEPEHWKEHLYELDATIFACIKGQALKGERELSPKEKRGRSKCEAIR